MTFEQLPAGESDSSGEGILGGSDSIDKHRERERTWHVQGTERTVGPALARRLETAARYLTATVWSLHFILQRKGSDAEREMGQRGCRLSVEEVLTTQRQHL